MDYTPSITPEPDADAPTPAPIFITPPGSAPAPPAVSPPPSSPTPPLSPQFYFPPPIRCDFDFETSQDDIARLPLPSDIYSPPPFECNIPFIPSPTIVPVPIPVDPPRGRSRSRGRASPVGGCHSIRSYSSSPSYYIPPCPMRRYSYVSPSRSPSRSPSSSRSPSFTPRRRCRPRSRTPPPHRRYSYYYDDLNHHHTPPPPQPSIIIPPPPPMIVPAPMPPRVQPIVISVPSPSPPPIQPIPMPFDPVDILTFNYNKNMAYAPAAKTYDEAIDTVLELWPELRNFDRDRISLLVGGTDQLVRVPKIAWQIVLSDLPRYEVMHVQVDQLPPPPQYQSDGKVKADGTWGSDDKKTPSKGFFSSIKKLFRS